jgi:hypothetical protein
MSQKPRKFLKILKNPEYSEIDGKFSRIFISEISGVLKKYQEL